MAKIKIVWCETVSNKELAKNILDIVGEKNILNAYNCMTRLRLQLAVKDTAINDRLKELDGVLGLNYSDNELQIILGPGKATNVANEFKNLLSVKPQIGDGKALHEEIRAKNATPAKLFLKKIAGIFVPLIPGFIACGLITGCVGLAIKINPELANLPTVKLLMIAGNAVFWGMNLFVGFNASKVFGGTPILGGILAALITHPGLAEVSLNGENLMPGRGGVISVVLIAALAAWIEGKLHKVIPEMFDLFLTPLITFMTAGTADWWSNLRDNRQFGDKCDSIGRCNRRLHLGRILAAAGDVRRTSSYDAYSRRFNQSVRRDYPAADTCNGRCRTSWRIDCRLFQNQEQIPQEDCSFRSTCRNNGRR